MEVLTVWECELRDAVRLARKLSAFLASSLPAGMP